MKYTKTIRASKNVRPARKVSASRAALQRKAVKADDEIDEIPAEVDDVEIPAEDVDVTGDQGSVGTADSYASWWHTRGCC